MADYQEPCVGRSHVWWGRREDELGHIRVGINVVIKIVKLMFSLFEKTTILGCHYFQATEKKAKK